MHEAQCAGAPIQYSPIGVIRSPFAERQGMPIQAAFAEGAAGTIELQPEYAEGLMDLEGFSHLILVYHFHHSQGYQLRVRPFLEEVAHGVFATRAPRRPNPIGISTVRLERIEGTRLYISGLDVVDGTPLLDIKPYVPQFDDRRKARIGWLEKRVHVANEKRADGRFG
jgi:tRNA-Thr(GGU) m(6)t(6)A37 methyltransferase TsaA